eukprot:COSAG06_NODE_61908_length_266_cov_0.922156_1_plen_50_part_10
MDEAGRDVGVHCKRHGNKNAAGKHIAQRLRYHSSWWPPAASCISILFAPS